MRVIEDSDVYCPGSSLYRPEYERIRRKHYLEANPGAGTAQERADVQNAKDAQLDAALTLLRDQIQPR